MRRCKGELVLRVGWSSKTECVEVVLTHGENGGGPVGEENNRM